jgi:hypothetical protein
MATTGPPVHTEDLALFSRPPVNVAERKKMWVDHLPSFVGKSSVQFTIPGTGSQYTDLSQTELYVKVSIKKKNGLIFEQTEDTLAIPVDNVLHSLWSNVDVKLNGVLVSTSNTNYMYKAYLETLLNYNQKARDNQLSMIGFTGDSGNFDQRDYDGVPANGGLQSRFDMWKGISTIYNTKTRFQEGNDPDEEFTDPSCVEFMGPLKADICTQDRLIMNGVSIDITLHPNSNKFFLTTFPDATEAEFKIEEIVLKVCKVSLSDAAFIAIEDHLNEKPALFPFKRTIVRTFTVNAGAYNDIAEDMFQGEVPSRLIVGMVDAQAYAGSYGLNPYRFRDFNLSSLAFYVDGESTPHEPFKLEFKDCNYLLGLKSLYRVTGKNGMNTDIPIDRTTYRQGNSLFGFEVDPTTSPDMSYVGKPRSGRTRLTLDFHKSVKRPITVVVYATFPETMQVDKSRLVCLEKGQDTLHKLQRLSGVCAG